MKTIISGRHIETELSTSDDAVLTKFIELFAPLIKLPRIGRYSKMGSEEVWQRLVAQVCVRGSARHMERIQTDPITKRDFNKAISLKEIKKKRKKKSYLTTVLKSFSATRFPHRAADNLTTLLKTPTVFNGHRIALFKGLSHKDDPLYVRNILTQRCPIFGLKSASDFMILVGLSHDVIALDTRVVRVFQHYFNYNLSPGKVQRKNSCYYSVEEALRKYCFKNGTSLAILDRILFRYSRVSAFEHLVQHPTLFKRIGLH
jgi:thermostable 8-oxoguanine DNA glycosylase